MKQNRLAPQDMCGIHEILNVANPSGHATRLDQISKKFSSIRRVEQVRSCEFSFQKISGRPNIRIRIRIWPSRAYSVRIRIRPNPQKVRNESESQEKLFVENFLSRSVFCDFLGLGFDQI